MSRKATASPAAPSSSSWRSDYSVAVAEPVARRADTPATTTAMPTTIAISSPQNQPALPVGLTTMFTITASSTTSSQRETSRMRRMRA